MRKFGNREFFKETLRWVSRSLSRLEMTVPAEIMQNVFFLFRVIIPMLNIL